MTIQIALQKLSFEYEALRKKNLKSTNPNVLSLMNNVVLQLAETGILKRFPNITMEFSNGQGLLPKKPTLYLKDNRETTKGTRGVYVVLRMETDPEQLEKGFLLALTQGKERVNKIKDQGERKEKMLKLRARAIQIAEEYIPAIKRKKNSSIRYADEIDFSDPIAIARKEFYFDHDIERDLLLDLRRLLCIYSDYVEDRISPDSQDRSYSLRLIELRLKQAAFKDDLWKKYKRCAVTGCNIKGIVDAAHIIPHSKMVNFNLENGLLLRADIHRLFDKRLLIISKNGVVHLHASIISDPEYGKFHLLNVSSLLDKNTLRNLGRISSRDQKII